MRLIDADAIEHCLVIGGRRHGKAIISEIIRRAIQTAPTVDAVPVIRCKECKYGSPNGVYGCVLERFNRLDKSERMYSNDYCSRAERKEK